MSTPALAICVRDHLHETPADAEACNRTTPVVIPGYLHPHGTPVPVEPGDAPVHILAGVLVLLAIVLAMCAIRIFVPEPESGPAGTIVTPTTYGYPPSPK